jgi:hypothetical protein
MLPAVLLGYLGPTSPLFLGPNNTIRELSNRWEPHEWDINIKG